MPVMCYNCSDANDGPVCGRCWKQFGWDAREDIKRAFNDDVSEGKHGADAQLICDVPGCWNTVKKKKMAIGRCFEHPKDADRDRSRSPVVQPADRRSQIAVICGGRRLIRPVVRTGVAAASSNRPVVPTTADVLTAARARLRVGVEMMQNAVNEIADAAASL